MREVYKISFVLAEFQSNFLTNGMKNVESLFLDGAHDVM